MFSFRYAFAPTLYSCEVANASFLTEVRTPMYEIVQTIQYNIKLSSYIPQFTLEFLDAFRSPLKTITK